MIRNEIEQIVQGSLEDLFRFDRILLQNDVSERAITHKLAEYIQRRIPKLNVDCEYNRDATQGNYRPKMLDVPTKEELHEVIERHSLDEVISISTYPDIIVHRRGNNAENLLIVEVKKRNSSVEFDHDYKKLRAFTDNEANPYHYRYGVFILLDTRRRTPRDPELRWFIEGAEESTSNNILTKISSRRPT